MRNFKTKNYFYDVLLPSLLRQANVTGHSVQAWWDVDLKVWAAMNEAPAQPRRRSAFVIVQPDGRIIEGPAWDTNFLEGDRFAAEDT